jgi:hypothetical protein
MSQNTLSAVQQKILNDLTTVTPGLKKGQVRKSDGGDIQLGDLVQTALKPVYTEDSFSATFDHSVGALTVVVRKIGKHTTLEIPAAAIANGAGSVAASGATDIPAAYRPATTLTAPALVIDNGTTRKAGQVVISSAGQITFSVLGAGFTNAQAAGWDRICVTFSN